MERTLGWMESGVGTCKASLLSRFSGSQFASHNETSWAQFVLVFVAALISAQRRSSFVQPPLPPSSVLLTCSPCVPSRLRRLAHNVRGSGTSNSGRLGEADVEAALCKPWRSSTIAYQLTDELCPPRPALPR